LPTKTPLPTPTPIPPLGGGPGEIAFASDRSGIPEIYLSDLPGKAKLIINVPGGACEPAWSPDGSRLVFVSPCKGPLDLSEKSMPEDTKLYIANADGSESTLLDTKGTGDSEPAWSPDGKKIAFTSVRDGQPLIYIYDLDTKEVKPLIDPAVVRTANPSADFAAVRQAAWSRPVGDQIVFAAKNLKADGVYQIWTVTASGEGLQQIVQSGNEFWDYLPTWSPDGKAITFSQRQANATVLPWAMRILYEERDGPGILIQGLQRPIEHFQYSPDGQWYVFEAKYVGEDTNIYYSLISGDKQTQLTHDPGKDFDPAWRP
jgi:Tol biopolymer transport system component